MQTRFRGNLKDDVKLIVLYIDLLTIIPRARMGSDHESIAHPAFGLMGYCIQTMR